MRIPRFFARPGDIDGDKVRLGGDEAVHAVRVLRISPGDTISVLDGGGVEHLVRVDVAAAAELTGSILETRARASEPRLAVTIAQGLPKGDKLESVIQKCTEIGAVRFAPLFTDRTVVDLTHSKATARLDRWRRIAMEAAKQAGRAVVPEVLPPMRLEALITWWNGRGPLLLLWEDEVRLSLRQALLETLPADDGELMLVIGPEGGLEPSEVAKLCSAGAKAVTLGPRILRTETAGPAALACALLLSGDLG